MKKLLVALATVAMFALALVGIASSPAQADCPYSGCKGTSTNKIGGPNKIEKGGAPTFKIKVRPMRANGIVTVTCRHRHAKPHSGSATLNGNNVAKVEMGRFGKRGTWLCIAQYERHDPFLASSDAFSLQVG